MIEAVSVGAIPRTERSNTAAATAHCQRRACDGAKIKFRAQKAVHEAERSYNVLCDDRHQLSRTWAAGYQRREAETLEACAIIAQPQHTQTVQRTGLQRVVQWRPRYPLPLSRVKQQKTANNQKQGKTSDQRHNQQKLRTGG